MTIRRQLALLGLLAVALLGAAVSRPAATGQAPLPPAQRGAAALVNGLTVPLALYRRELGIYRVTLPGAPPAADSPAGRAREAAAQDQALRQAVAETLIAHEAARRGIAATPAAIRAALARMRSEAGGGAALSALARSEGLRASDLWAIARTSVLDDALTRRTHDPHLIDRLYARARVIYYVGPDAGLRALAPAPQPGHPAPEVAATTLDGRAMTLSALRGAPVVLTIWSTACTWCHVEMPLLDRFARAHPAVHVVALDVGDDRASAAAYIRALGLHLPIWLDPDGAAASAYGLSGLPATFAIDRAGVVRGATIGALDSAAALQRAANPALT